jgi:predicted metal-dependent HD superfamily phosphohydrolase
MGSGQPRCHTVEVAAHLTEELREDLLARWSETHRKHHTVTHLHEMLDVIGLLAEAGIEFDREAVELAAWFHDAIYEIARDDNEDRSAELARELLSSSPIRDEVARLVLVTKTHRVLADDVNGAVLSDADLSVLGSEPVRYRAYAAAVREEYADVPDEAFRPARARVLTSLLDGPLFHTATGRERWEERARHNIAEEITALTR